MSKLHEFKIKFAPTDEIANWEFNDEEKKKCCGVQVDDQIRFKFEGPGQLASAIVLCGKMQEGLPSSPFKEGNNISITDGETLTVAERTGLWGFSIAFTAQNANSTTSFYYVPDPEMEVKNRPGSDD